MKLHALLRVVPPSLLFTTLVAAQLSIEVTHTVQCTRKTGSGDKIKVHYNGTLESDGTEFDSSYRRNRPFEFTIGRGQVIEGWEKGLLDMCIGEARKLTIPPNMGYGASGSGPIPPNSVLIFETELMGIEGVTAEQIAPPPPRPTIAKPDASPVESAPATPLATPPSTPTPAPAGVSSVVAVPVASASPTPSAAAKTSGLMQAEDNGECHLLGSYALFVQGALGLLAVSSLVYKRWRETPRRPLKIWFFDVSKQVVGSALLHLANLFMSMLSSGKFDVAAKTKATTQYAADEDGNSPNPCSFYLLNLAIDTTIGIPILVLLLKLLHRGFLLTPMARPAESIRSGNYGHPPRTTWWLKQCVIYFLGLVGMKFCVFVLFQLLPWIAWVGDWALRWTEGNEAIQITFVMFIFPLIMNAMQYWIIDGFIKDPATGGSHYSVAPGEESDSDEDDDTWLDRHRRNRLSGEESDEEDTSGARDALKEANPTVLPIRKNSRGREYDPALDGTQSGSSSSGEREQEWDTTKQGR